MRPLAVCVLLAGLLAAPAVGQLQVEQDRLKPPVGEDLAGGLQPIHLPWGLRDAVEKIISTDREELAALHGQTSSASISACSA